MSIFPTDTNTSSIASDTNTLYKEYAWDFDKNDFLLKDGKYVVVTGIEAIKVWIYKTLNTHKYRYMAYSQFYGNELEDLSGKGYSSELINSEAQRYLNEALLVNTYIKGIKNVNALLDNDKLSINFTAITVYGEVNINV